MSGLESEYGETINFVRLNVEMPENEQVQRGYGLRGHPTVAILNESGEVNASFIGEQSAETLRPAIEAVLP